MLSVGDIKTNPGLTFSIKSVQKSYHQNNPKYAVNAVYVKLLASVCYADIKQVCFWTT